MRILWHSNAPWTSTGYGVQTRLFVPRIKALGHDVAISAFYGLEGASINWQGIDVYPKSLHPYGMDVVANHAKDFKADVVISLIDAWVIDHKQTTATGSKWIPWFPVDHDSIPPLVLDSVRRAHRTITYAENAQTLAIEAGLQSDYVPHGVDTNVYKPMPKSEARAKLGFPDDAFIVGMVAANKGYPSRKALPTQFEAFARFREQHPNAMLYLHMHLGPEMDGINIPQVLSAVGVPEDSVKVCDQYRITMGYADSVMAGLYSAMDVLSSATMGEGFGVPIIEAQACGTPVIIGNWTAMPELLGAGWTVAESERILTSMNAYQHLPTVDGVLSAYEAAYEARNDLPALGEKARNFALGYDADVVTEKYWRPVLAEIESDINKPPKELPPVEVVS